MKRETLFQIGLISGIVAIAAFAGLRILKVERPRLADAHGEHHHADEEENEDEHHAQGEHGEEHDREHVHIRLTPEQRKYAGIGIEETRPATIKTMLTLYGKIEVNQDTMAHVVPRFPGVLKEVRKRLGEKVEKGEIVALVEANESLRVYEIKSEIAGTVIEKDATRGEFVRDDKEIFTIADVSTVWVHLSVFREDFDQLKVGQSVIVHHRTTPIEAKVDYISPFGAPTTQTMVARCVIPNASGDLRPGLFITADVEVGEVHAAVTVNAAAVQRLHEKPVVFVIEDDAFEPRVVELGAADRDRIEVRSGLQAGEKYVATNPFILKAEIGKGEAEHSH
ncbi:MAG TPA: efflux RND transporter periplasmic adaptor subunit [Chthoniobacteraceae bacterium]|nr:efflux RND transporter periplasmic adaptor subunit [Chthoniobacteraceae bacterium]